MLKSSQTNSSFAKALIGHICVDDFGHGNQKKKKYAGSAKIRFF